MAGLGAKSANLSIRRPSKSIFKGGNDLFDADVRYYLTDQGQTGLHDLSERVCRYNLSEARLDRLLNNGSPPQRSGAGPRRKDIAGGDNPRKRHLSASSAA